MFMDSTSIYLLVTVVYGVLSTTVGLLTVSLSTVRVERERPSGSPRTKFIVHAFIRRPLDAAHLITTGRGTNEYSSLRMMDL